MARSYDPRFVSKKRLAHLSLREPPAVRAPEGGHAYGEPAMRSAIVEGALARGQAIPRRFRVQRAQSLLDQRRALLRDAPGAWWGAFFVSPWRGGAEPIHPSEGHRPPPHVSILARARAAAQE